MGYHRLPSIRNGLRRLHKWLTTPLTCCQGNNCLACELADEARRKQ